MGLPVVPAESARNSAASASLSEAPASLVQAPTRSIDDVLFAVHVMDEDILNGVRGKPDQCAIRRAAWRQLALAGYRPERMVIGRTGAQLRIDGRNHRFEHSGSGFVSVYDEGLPVEPCVVNFTRRSTH